MLDRRAFRRVAALVILALPVVSRAEGPRSATGAEADAVLLNRLTFDATDADRVMLRTMDRDAWLDHQLTLPAHD